jgi:integrase
MARPANTTGHVYRLGKNRWRGHLVVGYDESGKPKRKYFRGKSSADVQAQIDEVRANVREGLIPTDRDASFADLAQVWLEEYVKPNKAASTYLSYGLMYRTHIAPELGRRKLADLTPRHVQGVLNKLRASGKGERMVGYTFTLVKAILKLGVKWGWVARNVADSVDRPRKVASTASHAAARIGKEDARAIMRAVEGHRLEALFTVALGLGLRRGEALGLLWSDVDLDRGIIRLSGSLQPLGSELVRTDLKTKSSRRILRLPEIARRSLKKHRARQLEDQLALGELWPHTGYVFTDPLGQPVHPRHMKYEFDRLLRLAGLPRMRLHDLRHVYATLLLAEGVPLKVISEMLGHSSTAVTAEVYLHVLEEMKEQATKQLDEILGSGEGTEAEDGAAQQQHTTMDGLA